MNVFRQTLMLKAAYSLHVSDTFREPVSKRKDIRIMICALGPQDFMSKFMSLLYSQTSQRPLHVCVSVRGSAVG